MKYLRNINPYSPVQLREIINHTGNKIASRALIDNENTEIRFFSFAEGESIDKEYYGMESLFIMIEGRAKILYMDSDEVIINGGEIVALESGINYGIQALTDVKLLNILVKA